MLYERYSPREEESPLRTLRKPDRFFSDVQPTGFASAPTVALLPMIRSSISCLLHLGNSLTGLIEVVSLKAILEVLQLEGIWSD